jgi:nicotinamidase/pyrazinamidase
MMLELRDTDALLVVDVQRDFLPGGALAVPRGDEIVPPLAACIRLFVEHGLPIVASRDWHPSNHCSFRSAGGQWPPHCIAGSRGAELDPGLRLPPRARIVDKAQSADRDAYSAFDGTDLDAWLKGTGVRRVFIGGLATEYCVLSTARDARRLGYDVVLLSDAIRPIDAASGDEAVQTLCRAQVMTALTSDLLEDRQ